jgi:NADP-dependent 3-hydroxy acid dehydrogenase YdfG
MNTSHNSQTAIITGGATGIGYAVAEQFLQQGANIVLIGRTEEKLAAAAEKLGRSNRIAILAADITQPEASENIVNTAIERFSHVDVLVNNAGIFHTRPFTEYTLEELDGFLGYLRGTSVLTQATVRRMRMQGDGGAIINISTILRSQTYS